MSGLQELSQTFMLQSGDVFCGYVMELDAHPRGDVLQWGILPIKMGNPIQSGVEDPKVVVRVLVLT